MYDRMLEQNYTLVISNDFKKDKNQKIMFFGDIYLYF